MRARGLLWPWGPVLLAACAELPPARAPETPKPTTAEVAVASATAAHRKQAELDMAAGDLAGAKREWQILALLAPGNAQFRAQQEATDTAIEKGVGEQLKVASAATRAGDSDRAGAALLKVLALDPDNAEAKKALREIDRQKLARIQGNRAARVSHAANGSAKSGTVTPPEVADASESYDIDQRIEMFRAGDLEGGLKELHAFVDANPNNLSARQRIASVVYDRAREADAKGSREQALMLIDQASALRGKPLPEWSAQAQRLRKSLSDEYYDRGMRAYRTDMAAAIKSFETSLRYDPGNRKSAAKLHEARAADDKLKRIQKETKLP